MSTSYKVWNLVDAETNRIKMNNVLREDICIRINQSTVPIGIGIDGSSNNTGLSFMSKIGTLLGTCAFASFKKEDFIEYKLRFKAELTKILLTCKDKISHIWYEEPFIGFTRAAEVLLAIRTTVKEILLEHKEKLGHIVYKEVNNKRWKKIFLEAHGSRLPSGGSELEKKAVADILSKKLIYDTLENPNCCVTQDEMDATGLAYAGWYGETKDIDLASKKPVHKFKFNIKFEIYNATTQEIEQNIYALLNSACSDFKIPPKVLDNGITVRVLSGRKLFDNIVYETMADTDKLLIFIYNANKYANILLEYGVEQGIAEQIIDFGNNQTLVAYIWRKARR